MDITSFADHDRVMVGDIFGYAEDTFTGKEVELLARGLLPDGWEIKDSEDIDQHMPAIAAGASHRLQRAPNGLLFAVPQGSIENEKDMNDIRLKYEHIKRTTKIDPLILVTQVDIVEPAVRKNAMKKFPKIEALCDLTAAKLGVTR